MLKETLYLLLVSCMIGTAANTDVAAKKETVPRLVREIPPSMLADSGKTVHIKAFDVAPDGSAVAMLYASWGSSPHPTGEELWVATWDISSNKLVWTQRIGTDTLSGVEYVHDVKGLIFTADQSHLLAFGLKTVWSIDAKSGAVLPSISTPDYESGVPVQIQALSGTTVAITYAHNEGDKTSFYTAVIDVSSGKKASGWPTSEIPDSFSQDGRLAITVTPGYGVAVLRVIDAATGAELRSIPVGIGFDKSRPHEGISALARFLGGTQVVVLSNHRIYHPAKHAEYGLELVDASDGRQLREIIPEYFAPAGELVVSGDRNEFVVPSIYARNRDLLSESVHPKDLRVNLFVFSKDSTTPEMAIPNVYAGLAGGKGEPLAGLSSDGSVLAVSASPSGSIKIFQIGAP